MRETDRGYVVAAPLGLGTRTAALASLGAARLLARAAPHRIARVLARLGGGTRPATAEEALAAHRAVLAANVAVGRGDACLRRSLAVVLLTRMRGRSARWCVGVRLDPPMLAHAWVETADGPVGEDIDPEVVGLLFSVEPGRGVQ